MSGNFSKGKCPPLIPVCLKAQVTAINSRPGCNGQCPQILFRLIEKVRQCIYRVQYQEKQNLFPKPVIPKVKAEQIQASVSRDFSCSWLCIYLVDVSYQGLGMKNGDCQWGKKNNNNVWRIAYEGAKGKDLFWHGRGLKKLYLFCIWLGPSFFL